jgi:N-methylhydantoinase A
VLVAGIDVGGTFTDLVLYDEATQTFQVIKVPSTPANPAEGVLSALESAGVPLGSLLRVTHGTTVATNALITRNLPRTGLITTKGFRDVLEIRRGNKPDLWDAYVDVAPPYVPRRNRLEVEERILYDGSVHTPLNEDDVRHVLDLFRKRGIRTIAVSLINSYANPVHEQRIKEIAEEMLPDIPVTVSSEVLPELFEFERTSTTVINAALRPVLAGYLENLEEKLRERGYERDLLILHSGGGVMTPESAGRFPARTAASGLAGGAIAMAHIAQLSGFDNAIGLDMGGTSTDISLMYRGRLRTYNEWQVEFGYPIRFPAVEVVTIGAGGGSIAWIDEGGSLRNGPQSAGAQPGPAAYGHGGSEPTNTDANLLLGRLGPALLGGALPLSRQAAEAAVQKLADRLNLSLTDTAVAIIRVANANMANAIRLISIQRGYDPRDFALVAFGGAGPLHAVDLARELSIPTVIVPEFPGITSALGCLLVDLRHDHSQTFISAASTADVGEIEARLRELEGRMRERLRHEGVEESDIEIVRYIDMRYLGQWRSLSVEAPSPLDSLDLLLERFHAEHQREFAFSRPDHPVEIYGLRITAFGRLRKPELPRSVRAVSHPEPTEMRSVYFAEVGGFVSTPVYQRSALGAGVELQGPAVIEQLDSTTLLPPGSRATVDEYRHLIITV